MPGIPNDFESKDSFDTAEQQPEEPKSAEDDKNVVVMPGEEELDNNSEDNEQALVTTLSGSFIPSIGWYARILPVVCPVFPLPFRSYRP